MNNSIKNSKSSFFLLVLGLGLFISSCCKEDCASFSSFRLCDTQPTADGCSDNSTTLPQDADYLTVSVEIKDGDADDQLTMKLFLEENNSFTEFVSQTTALRDIEGYEDKKKIRASTGVSRRIDRLWPVGNYKVEIELTQENIPLNETQNFRIE